MFKGKKWVSIRRLKIQEFFLTLRYIKDGGASWHDIYLRLGEIQEKTSKAFLKSLSPLLISYLLLVSLSDDRTISITFQSITASIPTSFATLVSSLAVFVSFQQLQSAVMMISIRSTESARLRLYRFSANAYGLYHGQDDMALSVPVLQNFFLKEKLPISKLLSSMMLLTYSLILVPMMAFYIYLLNLQIDIVLTSEAPLLEHIAATLGVMTLVFAAIFIILFNIPLPFAKNKFGIRWGFLCNLYPMSRHPQLGIWLEESEDNKTK